MFELNALPAKFGDCIWIKYGDESEPNNILIDGGTGGTRRHIEKELIALPPEQRQFELVVVTHVDNDHIAGILRLLEEELEAPPEEKLGLIIDDLWFNGWPQLNELSDISDDIPLMEISGIEQGESLTTQIRLHKLPWNKSFEKSAVVVPANDDLPKIKLPGGMELTVLSPTPADLDKLKDDWKEILMEANLIPGTLTLPPIPSLDFEVFGTPSIGPLDIEKLAESDFDPDGSPANRSSIALVAEFEGKRVLLTGDAHADILIDSLTHLQPDAPVHFDLIKASHHGAQGTTSMEFVRAVDCQRYLFLSNGSNYKHPHAEAVACVIDGNEKETELIFNYKSERNKAWGEMAVLNTGFKFHTIYPEEGKEGIAVDI